ncbi:unnamed protein product [Ilex paraguariensis]|uniref:Uncharacterized protein n=1 Tax=Ilex paraguariensis TaxID=185542 RepID=A0ABC8TYB3_9AQUA
MNSLASASPSHPVDGNARNGRVAITTSIPALICSDGSRNAGIVSPTSNVLPEGTINAPLPTTTANPVVEIPQNQVRPAIVAGSWCQVVKQGKEAAQHPQSGESFSKMKLHCPRVKLNNEGTPKDVVQHISKGDKGKDKITALNESSAMREQSEALNNLQAAECSGPPTSLVFPTNGTLSTILEDNQPAYG